MQKISVPSITRGLQRFIAFEILFAIISLVIGLFVPPIKIPPSWLNGLVNVTSINLMGMWMSFGESIVRFIVWLVYALAFRRLVVNNAMLFTTSLASQITDDDGNDSPAWLISAGYIGLGIILGLKVSFATLGGFLLFAPFRVLWGSLLALSITYWLLRSEIGINKAEKFMTQIGMPKTNGVAILVVAGCLIGAAFA